ncbi:hypothetical protein RRG08_055322 [Elysia crispata]|uniref:Uncharacterized protein n=1 Tax=Elysia crispata TaxID=231223 RepID=A0AAE1AQV6_9GAST|nr:hypothetical protein RRG08_055322 [Elysia crispata]
MSTGFLSPTRLHSFDSRLTGGKMSVFRPARRVCLLSFVGVYSALRVARDRLAVCRNGSTVESLDKEIGVP